MYAIESLAPNSDYVIFGDEYSGIEWRDTVNAKPTEEEVNKKIADLQAEEPFKQLRAERNWKNYRQALRDLPSKSNPKLNSYGDLDMSSVTWPDKPSS